MGGDYNGSVSRFRSSLLGGGSLLRVDRPAATTAPDEGGIAAATYYIQEVRVVFVVAVRCLSVRILYACNIACYVHTFTRLPSMFRSHHRSRVSVFCNIKIVSVGLCYPV